MRVDDYLSTVGVVKRRTVAKELGQNGLITINGQRAKPATNINVGDVIHIKGNRSVTVEVLEVPAGSVPKDKRDKYFKTITHEG